MYISYISHAASSHVSLFSLHKIKIHIFSSTISIYFFVCCSIYFPVIEIYEDTLLASIILWTIDTHLYFLLLRNWINAEDSIVRMNISMCLFHFLVLRVSTKYYCDKYVDNWNRSLVVTHSKSMFDRNIFDVWKHDVFSWTFILHKLNMDCELAPC